MKNLAKYTSEILFLSTVASPWEVSEDQFVAATALLMSGEPLEQWDRENLQAFFALACEAASEVCPTEESASGIYRCACAAVRLRGGTVHASQM